MAKVSESSTPKNEEVSETPANPRIEKGLRHLFADADFNEMAGTLLVGGTPVSVEPRPLRLLAELLRRVNEVVTKDELFEAVWAGRVTVDHVLANAVSKLRGALGEQAGARIVNVPRVGYRLDGPVRRIAVGVAQRDLVVGDPVPGREGYVLERALGPEGGSQVWLARHAKLGQAHVFKFAEDESRLGAIKREYTLYRVLQAELGPRDDFVRVLDTQFATAPYFIECEYGGASLLEWADVESRLAALPIAERLGLFLQMARAVAAAHSVGVLHKDLKPANVLVAGEPGAWKIRLTDFGSGRLLDPDQLGRLQLTAIGMTQTGLAAADSRSGTLMYMAPELLTGQSATTQSDVYALGLMLYQMIVGDLRRPMATGWERDIDDDLLRDDIRAATDGSPQSRLKAVDALIERVSTLAARRTAQQSAQKMAKEAADAIVQLQRVRARRPWVVAVVGSLAIGLGGSLWFAMQARSSQRQAEQQAARADEVMRFMTTDLLSGVDISGVGKDATVSMRAVLDRAARRVGDRFKAEPRTEAFVRHRLADLYFRAGMFNESRNQSDLGLEQLARSPLADGVPDAMKAEMHFGHGSLLAQLNKIDEAQVQIDLAEKERARMSPQVAGRLEQEALGARLFLLQAREQYKQALPVAKGLVDVVEGNPQADPLVKFNARLVLVETLYRVGDFAQAQREIETALQVQPAEQIGPVVRARALLMRARVKVAAGQPEGVEADLITARDTFVLNMGPNYQEVAVANVELGNIYDARGDFERSVAVLQQAYQGMSATLGKEHSNTRIVGLNLAIAEINLGRAAVGLLSLEAGRVWFAANMGGDDGAVVQAIDFERARAMTALARPAEALAILARLKHERLAEATPARDWAFRLDAERARAMIAGSDRAAGLKLLEATLPQLRAHGTSPWVLESYQRILPVKTAASGR